jgi:membrane protein implicated in regulation of membrane protease activity
MLDSRRAVTLLASLILTLLALLSLILLWLGPGPASLLRQPVLHYPTFAFATLLFAYLAVLAVRSLLRPGPRQQH